MASEGQGRAMQTRSGTDRLIDGAPSTPCLHHREKGLGLGRPLVVCEEGSKGRGKRDSRRWEDWAAVKGCFYSTGRLGQLLGHQRNRGRDWISRKCRTALPITRTRAWACFCRSRFFEVRACNYRTAIATESPQTWKQSEKA